ncbi:MAG: uracil-DNA glycosylase family 4 [Arenicella sp.]|jgi:uracil-DNA glycosylase family 4
MNTLEHIGIQSWRLRKAQQDSVAPIAEAADVAEIHLAVPADNTQDAMSGLSQPEITSEGAEVSPVTAQAGFVEAKPIIDSEVVLTNENQSTQDDPTRGGSLASAGWLELADMLLSASSCQSCERSNPVLGDGDLEAKWVFVFDAPSAKDVSHQQLLSGRTGQLFDAILDAIGLNRELIYLTSVFKCPPSQDLSLAAQCGSIVHRQIQLIKPKVVITLGEFASQTVLRANENLIHLRSEGLHNLNDGTLVAATYSLSEMLENPELKASVWQDLKKCLAQL